jgi:DNA replicative helicase MCM subunit Mcm2 (Cdc46/Mcm family)
MPRTVECELTEDLVDACIPGDVVTVCGIVKIINTDMDVGGGIMKHFKQINSLHFVGNGKSGCEILKYSFQQIT